MPWYPFSQKKMDEYLNEEMYYKLCTIINLMPTKEGKILIGSIAILSPGRWLKKPFIQEGLPYFNDFVKKNKTLEEAYNELKELNVSYLLFKSSMNDSFTNAFIEKYCKPIFEYQGLTFYELK
jgi:hypothetical protein